MTEKLLKNKKVLFVDGDILIASSGYYLFISKDNGDTWIKWAKVFDKKYALLSKIRLISRLLRIEVTEVFKVKDEYYCIAKKGIFKYENKYNTFEKIFVINRGSRPINIAIDNEDNVYFGEYFDNKNRVDVNIYMMKAGSSVFEKVYVFKKNMIRHIHGIYYDKYENILWYVTGDEDHECIIGYTKDQFKSINNILIGSQQFRAVKLFFYEDYIIYATDTPNEENFVYKIERKDYKVEKILPVIGSVIYGVQNEFCCFISTTVEPSKVNSYKYSALYYSFGGNNWVKLFEYEKDCYSMKLFQFGSIIFPKYETKSEYLYFYGRALKKIDGNSIRMKLSELMI
jgi:hypothetical protein